MAGRFLCLPLCGRCGSAALAVYRVVAASRRLACLGAYRFRGGSSCPSVIFVSLVFASPRRHAVAADPIIPSFFVPFSRYGGRGSVGACGVWRRFRVRMVWYHPAPFLPEVSGCLLRRRVLIVPSRSSCRIAWCGRLLEKRRRLVRPFSSWRCVRHFASPGCLPNCPSFAYLVRFSYISAFAPGNRTRPVPRVELAGRRTGRGFAPVLDLLLGNVNADGDGDVDGDECGRR